MGRLIKSLALALLIPFAQTQAEPEDESQRVIIKERNFYRKVINPEHKTDNLTRAINAILLYSPQNYAYEFSDKKNASILDTYYSEIYDELSGSEFYYNSRDPLDDDFPFEEKFINALLSTASKHFSLVRDIEDKVEKVQDATRIDYVSLDEVKYTLEPIVNKGLKPGLKFSIDNIFGADELYLETTLNEYNWGIERKTKLGELRFRAEFNLKNTENFVGFYLGTRF